MVVLSACPGVLRSLLSVLPGKKSSELGEYDPLTQADSEDESEEDDLVLNYPRNGLGRGGCLGARAADLRTGRAGRLVEEDDEVEEDEEEWREQYPGKNRQEREELKTRQYWSQREDVRDGGSDGGGSTGLTGSSGLGLGSGLDLEEKAARLRQTIRTAFFLVPLCGAVVLVLLCAFLLPCKQSELEKSPQWERELGEAGGKPWVTVHGLDRTERCNIDLKNFLEKGVGINCEFAAFAAERKTT